MIEWIPLHPVDRLAPAHSQPTRRPAHQPITTDYRHCNTGLYHVSDRNRRTPSCARYRCQCRMPGIVHDRKISRRTQSYEVLYRHVLRKSTKRIGQRPHNTYRAGFGPDRSAVILKMRLIRSADFDDARAAAIEQIRQANRTDRTKLGT